MNNAFDEFYKRETNKDKENNTTKGGVNMNAFDEFVKGETSKDKETNTRKGGVTMNVYEKFVKNIETGDNRKAELEDSISKLKEELKALEEELKEENKKPVTKKVTKIRFGNLAIENEVPRLTISVFGNDEFMLVPFRMYCMQVCDISGSGDYGSSDVIGLKHVLQIKKSSGIGYQSNSHTYGIQREMLKGQAFIALHNFCTYFSNQDIEICLPSSMESKEALNGFLDACMEYMK